MALHKRVCYQLLLKWKLSVTNSLIRITVLLLIFNSGQTAVGQQSVQFAESGLAAALEQSRITQKPVLFFCFASWCPHCKKMRETLFTDNSVAAYYNQHFICVEQDMEKGAGIDLHKQFDIKSYPTYIFIDSDGTVIYRMTGEFKPPQFIAEGENALSPKKQLPYLKQQFEKDVSNPDKCLEYLRALKKGEIDYTDVVKKYFATQPDSQLLTEKNWLIIANGTTDINSREFQFLLSHQKEYASIASKERVDRKIFYLVKTLLTPLLETNDTINYFINRQSAKAIGSFSVDSLLFAYDINMYHINADWKAYQKETIESVEKYVWNSYSQLSDIAKEYLNHVSDADALNQAVKWIKRSLALHQEYGNYILCARLYQKLNQKPGALQMAQMAKENALKDGWDHTEADNLIKELH